RESRADFPLNVQIPRLNVSIVEAGINRGRSKPGSAGDVHSVVESDGSVKSQRSRKRRIRRVAGYGIRHGLIGQNRVGTAHARPSVFERVPGESYSRLDVAFVVFIQLAIGDPNQRAGCLVEVDEAVESLCRRYEKVITQAEFEREIRLELEVVLHEKSN